MTDPIELPILFEDGDLLAVNKPEGLASIPERTQDKESALSLLTKTRGEKLFVVDRLDKDVSGVMLFAKNAELHAHLDHQFDLRNVKKSYLAVVHGVAQEDKGTIKKPIREFGSGRMAVDLKVKKLSTTHYRVKNRMTGFTLMDIEPATRQRHQIRVHFYSIFHPIVGDPLYGDPTIQKTYPRLMLHSAAIEFKRPSENPLGGETIRIEAVLPESFRSVLNKLQPS